ncbi:MAG: VWA domain-containing protein, partial [Candidatus Kapaibacterium sp.]
MRRRRGAATAWIPALALCVLLFTGCPQMLIERVEKILPPPGYKPRFNTSSVSLDSLADRYKAALRSGTVDSSLWYDESVTAQPAVSVTSMTSDSTSASAPTPSTTAKPSLKASAFPAPTMTPATMQRVNATIASLPKEQQDTVRRFMMMAMMGGARIPADTLRGRAERMLASLPADTRDTLLQQFARMRDASVTGSDLEPSESDTSGLPSTPRRSSATEAPARIQIRSLIDQRFPDEIELQLILSDPTGRAILGCAPPYLSKDARVRDYWTGLVDSCNGIATSIGTFSVEEVRESANDPYALAFVIDHSGSMGKVRIRKLREAVKATMSIIGTQDMVTVMPFAGSSGVDIPLTSDTALMRASMDIEKHASIKPGTAIYDATLHALRELTAAPREKKRAILMFTDGEDGSSKSKLNDAIRAARDSGVAVYAIAYGLTNEEPLLALAQKTGGQFYRIYSTREFPLVFRDIYRSLKNYYRVRYKPAPCAGIHTVRAELRIPEIGVKRLVATGRYDKSVFTDLDSVGSITFLNIEFATGSADIQPGSSGDLDVMAAALLAHPRTV